MPTGYLAAPDFVDELTCELGGAVREAHERLLLTDGPPQPAAWAHNVWYEPERITFGSITEAARVLRERGRNWALYATRLHRRAALITAKLPPFHPRPLPFGAPLPAAPLGSWTLLDEHTLLAAPRCASPFAHGELELVEDKQEPPSRAYLKLWELFTRLQRHPAAGERCLDLGASPGGWTWVLQRLGAHVVAVDKAPLAPQVAHLPGVEYRQQSAFALEPRDAGPVDWLFSDVICYPARLLALVERWRAAGTCPRFVCTIKFTGATDHATARAFAAIPGSQLMHLHHNRHELTWVLVP